MKLIEPPKQAKQRLLSEEQTSSWLFQVLRLGLALGTMGALGFLLPFLQRTALRASGIQWRDLQTYGLLLVFAGGLLFVLSAAHFGIDASGMTLDRLVSIVRNEVYTPPRDTEHLRRHVNSALSSLGDDWCLYPDVFTGRAGHQLPFVVAGPSGIFGIALNTGDPRRRGYGDPAPGLQSACGALQGMLTEKVTPVLLFLRDASQYENTHPRVKVFTAQELIAWLEARKPAREPLVIQAADRVLRAHQTRDPL